MHAASLRPSLRDSVRRWFPFLLQLVHDERHAAVKGSLLARYWAVVLPLFETGMFTLIFGLVLRQAGRPGVYIPFAFVGVFVWRVFSRAVTRAGTVLQRYGLLVQMVAVPILVLIAASVVSGLLEGLFGLPILLAVLLWGPGVGAASLLWLPVALLLQVSFSLGLGLLVATLGAYNRDVSLMLTPALGVLMFAAPVVYPATLVPQPWRELMLALPMSAAVESYRAALLGTAPPGAATLLWAGLLTLAVLGVGLVTATRLNHAVREAV